MKITTRIPVSKIIRTRRKTLAVEITEEAAVIVRAPFRVSDRTIARFVSQHEQWITKKMEEGTERARKSPPPRFEAGEQFPFLGQSFPLKIVDTRHLPLILEAGEFLLSEHTLPREKDVFIDWYRERAGEIFPERVRLQATGRNFNYGRVRISNARKRWGSCSPNGNLNFSWRLVMAPLPVIDYVVVHELVHLQERNHSKRFWSKVAVLIPDYKKQRTWLRENGGTLTL